MTTGTSTETQTPPSNVTDSPPASSVRAMWAVVARREVAVKLRDRAFIIGSLAMLAVIVGALALQVWMAEREQTYTVVATGSAEQMSTAVAQAAPQLDDKITIEVKGAGDDAAARAELANGTADAWLRQDGDRGWVLTGQESVPSGLETVMTQGIAAQVTADNAQEAGLTPEQLTAGSAVHTALVVGDAEQRTVAMVISIVLAILFYFSAVIFGQQLANSVVEEKQSRIVEIISTSIPVSQLLIGKLVGNIVLAVGQMAIYLGVGLAGLSLTSYSSILPSIAGGMGWFLAFFLAGFTFIAAMFLVAGALASRTEDVQSTAMPATMVAMLMFFGALFMTGSIQAIASWIPPFSAIIMPMRVIEGTASWWQALIALVLLVAATAATLGAASRIYRRALLQTSGKLSMREAWTAET